MPLAVGWLKIWIYLGFVFGWSKTARPRFDTSTDMGLVLIPADAEIDSVIFRLRATDQDADFPLVFDITATITPVVRIENLPCTLYNKVCQANVILTRRLIPGRLHDFAVRVRDSKGDVNTMQATLSVTNATTPRDQIFPHIPSLIMVPEDTKPGKELDYLLVRANPWSGKPVYIELWQPKELFTIRQRQTPTQTRGVITLIGELDFETQSMYTLTMYATDPYTEPGKDTRNIAGLNVVVVVQDVQDVPPIFTLAPPLTRINNSVQPGDIVLRVHAEDGDKGVPREILYGLVSEGNPFTPFFNISETTGEIVLARPLEELTQITHVGAPVVLSVVAEEIRRSTEEPPTQATVVEVGFLLGEPGNSPPYFESDNYVTMIDENPEPGTVIIFPEQYSTKVRDEDIGKAGVFALKLENNNGTFEINPTVAERSADFIITVRDNALADYELYKSLSFKIIAQEVGPATNLSTSVPVKIFLRDVNDNPPVFDEDSYEVTLSENVTAGTRVIQVRATDKDTGSFGDLRYTRISGVGSEAFTLDPDTGTIIVSMGSSLDREATPRLQLSVEARDESGNGNRGSVPLIVNLLDVNDNAPIFQKEVYEFTLNADLTNFTTPAVIAAIDADAEPPNNEVRYELVHGNYENKFYLNEITGELILRSPITKVRRKKQSTYDNLAKKVRKEFVQSGELHGEMVTSPTIKSNLTKTTESVGNQSKLLPETREMIKNRRKRDNGDALYTLTARAYDLGVPHMSSVTEIRIVAAAIMEARIVMFVVPGEHPDPVRTAETLSLITGGRVIIQEIRPYVSQNQTNPANMPAGKKSVVLARVQQNGPDTPLVDIEKIRDTLAANGVGIIGTTETVTDVISATKSTVTEGSNVNGSVITVLHEEATIYKAENRVLFWLLLILGLLMLAAIATLILCCICPSCPFYMAPRKRRVHSSEALVARPDGRPKRHIHRPQATAADGSWTTKKQAWSADATRRNWQFNRRNTRNLGLASLPGDVVYISGRPSEAQMNVNALREDPMTERDELYREDIEAQRIRGYEMTDVDSLQQQELDRGSDVHRQTYRYVDENATDVKRVREQHFFREGNAEVLRLVTRGQSEDQQHQAPTFVVDGKDILLRRFMEDQRLRHDASMHDIEAARSMESHQRPKETLGQQEIILLPERLDLGHRSHLEDLSPDVQRLIIDHRDYEETGKPDPKESRVKISQHKQEVPSGPSFVVTDVSTTMEKQAANDKDQTRTVNVQSYTIRDMELARQNALLTRLLLERDSRGIGLVVDSTSYLETQSLPGQVAIATQTDRSAATQTERHVRSRSDNESDDDTRQKKKLKSKKRHGDAGTKRRTLWMKSPIEEEGSPGFDKRLNILRRKVKEVKDGRKGSLEPDVLREISDSLDGTEENESTKKVHRQSTEESGVRYKVLNDDASGSSTGLSKEKYDLAYVDKTSGEDKKRDVTESTSSPEIAMKTKKFVRGKNEQKSPKKDKEKSSRKNVENVVEPSFRVLEKEITLLTKKLSKLGTKKAQDSTTSESNNQDKVRMSRRDLKRETDQKLAKKVEDSSARDSKSAAESGMSKTSAPTSNRHKESFLSKTRQKLQYQKHAAISTGSSEYEDSTEKPKKQISTQIQDSVKQKQSNAPSKLKRQPHVERKDEKKLASTLEDRESQKEKISSVKEVPRDERKVEKTARTVVRGKHLAAIGRRDHVPEELSTSTSSDKTQSKKDKIVRRESEKKTSTDTSESLSERGAQRKARKSQEKIVAKVEEPKKEIKRNAEAPTLVEMKEKGKDVNNETDLTPSVVDAADRALNGFVKEPAMTLTEVLRDSVTLGQTVSQAVEQKVESLVESKSKDAQATEISDSNVKTEPSKTIEENGLKAEKKIEKMESDDDKASPEKSPIIEPSKDCETEEKFHDEKDRVESIISGQQEIKREEPKILEKLENDVQGLIKSSDKENLNSLTTTSQEIVLPKKISEPSSSELPDVVHEGTSKIGSPEVTEVPTKTESIEDTHYEVVAEKSALTEVSGKDEKDDEPMKDYNAEGTKPMEFLAKDVDSQQGESSSKVSEITAEMLMKEREESIVQSAAPSDSEEQSKSVSHPIQGTDIPVEGTVALEKDEKHDQSFAEAFHQSSENVGHDVEGPQETIGPPAIVEGKLDKEKKDTDSKEERYEDPVLKEQGKEESKKAEVVDELRKEEENVESGKGEHKEESKKAEVGDELKKGEENVESGKGKHKEETKKVEVIDELKKEKEIVESEKEEHKEELEKDEKEEGSKKQEDMQGSKKIEDKDGSKKEEDMQGSKKIENKDGSKKEEDMQGSKKIEDKNGSKKEEDMQGSKRVEDKDGSEKEEHTAEGGVENVKKEEVTMMHNPEENGTEGKAEPGESREQTAQISDVSTPIFTSAIDTLGDSDDSDTSSDISRETTLAAGPYQTPRHHPRLPSEHELQELTGHTDIDDAEILPIEVEEKYEPNIQDEKEESVESGKESVAESQEIQTIEDVIGADKIAKRDNESKMSGFSGTIIPDVAKPFISSNAIDKDGNAGKSTRNQQLSTGVKDSSVADVVSGKQVLKDGKQKIAKGTGKGQIGKDANQRASDKKSKHDKLRISPARKERKAPDEGSSDKTISKPSVETNQTPRHRSHRPPETDLAKKKENDQTKPMKKKIEDPSKQAGPSKPKIEKDRKDRKDKTGGEKLGADIDVSKTQSKYMSWYKEQREETERRRLESKEDDDQLPRWVRRSLNRKVQQEMTPRTRRKVKPLVNVESEQLKAIVRQGRKLRRAEGASEDPTIQIFAAEPPPARSVQSNHHLLQHSAYKFERIPPPFYLHPPPPVPHPSPQLSPQRLHPDPSEYRVPRDDLDSGTAIALQGGNRLRHQQLLEKKSVFDIAYSEAAPPQLRADSTTPPS